jgi:hypothetical protein
MNTVRRALVPLLAAVAVGAVGVPCPAQAQVVARSGCAYGVGPKACFHAAPSSHYFSLLPSDWMAGFRQLGASV